MAKRLATWEVTLHAIVRTSISVFDKEDKLLASKITLSDWNTIAPSVDIIFLCCPQTKDNIGFVDAAFLAHVKDGVVIVNVARGGLLNYGDIAAALDSGRVRSVCFHFSLHNGNKRVFC